MPMLIQPRTCDGDRFEALCAANPDLRLERAANGEILVMEAAGFETGFRNNKISTQLDKRASQDGRGVSVDSGAGYALPNGAMRSPDASWVLRSRLEPLTAREKGGFLPLCPDFVIELRSPSDSLTTLQDKMSEWIDQGVKVAWLIDPQNRSVHVYVPGQAVKLLTNPDHVQGEGPVEGFTLELGEIWRGL